MTARPKVSPELVLAGEIPVPHLERYRLEVLAPSVVEVVESVGGWLFDRAMAGWQVTVLLESTREDPLPIHILGGEVATLDAVPHRDWYRTSPDSLAVAADLCSRDHRVRRKVQLALNCRRNEVALWGQTWPAELNSVVQLDKVEYRLSIAARAFKTRALAAAARPVEALPVVEVIRCNLTAMQSRTAFPPTVFTDERR